MGDSDSLSFNQIQDNSDDLGALEETDECVCCCEVLEDSLLLTCLHSICRSCVDSQTTDHIKCPRCRSTSSCHNLVKDYLHSVDPPQPRHWDSQDTVVEMTGIISRGRERIEACNENINKLTNNLGELHEEREKMKQQIEDTYKIFSSVLERRREESMLQLENIFNDRELSTMDQLEDLNLSQAHLEHTIQYVSRVISEFPDTEARSILPMAKVQLESNMRVLDTLSRQDKPAQTLVCKSDLKLFQKAVRDSFGSFGNYDDSSVSAENLVIPEIAQRNVINSRSTHTKAITNMDRSRMLPTSTDLLSPQGGDQGFVSPGDHLLSPLGDHQGLLSLGKPGLSLQVPSYSGQHGSLSVPVGSPRGPSPRSHGPIGSNLSSPSHHGYSSGRMGNSHPDLSYAAHTPPLYGRGHTPPLQGSGHTPPLITQDTTHRNDFSLAELADKINRSNSGPSHHNFTLAELISNVAENPNKDWDGAPTPSQAYSNLAALAKLDEMQDKSGNWSSVDHNLLLPDLERSSLSRSMSALTSGQLSPIPLRAQGSPSPYGLNIPGLDHRGVSPISPIDGMMPSMPGAPGSPFPPIRGNRSVSLLNL
ncbi:uncharacterized protein LOC111712223 [Eurytemora carolleeae]|uniref:uncharacterized protein LOC111712223 n=1 Tax=Eurytemora carolleeae TaxID=1294199 RepID=UPI000C766962|nr:uncharacterized protein LOC111712223 [Eurytemora carolleeae]|eukprot:XP_023342549.1 uncharacterized protein LOC111712223 [Eurytemora affinis]